MKGCSAAEGGVMISKRGSDKLCVVFFRFVLFLFWFCFLPLPVFGVGRSAFRRRDRRHARRDVGVQVDI